MIYDDPTDLNNQNDLKFPYSESLVSQLLLMSHEIVNFKFSKSNYENLIFKTE